MGALKERRLTSFQTSLMTIYNHFWLAALYSHAPTKQLNLNNITNHINNTCTCIGSNNLTFLFSKKKDLQKMLLRKLSFLHLLFLQHKDQTSEKITGQYFFTKQTCPHAKLSPMQRKPA